MLDFLQEKSNSKKSVAIWLICEGKILLQKRAKTEITDGIKGAQSNIGICQPTVNEKVEENESAIEAVKRGISEELGEGFAHAFDDTKLRLFSDEQYSYDGKTVTSYNFWGTITQDQFKLIMLHFGAEPEFIAVGAEDLPNIKSKNSGADPKINTVLFEDQYRVLKKLFAVVTKESQ